MIQLEKGKVAYYVSRYSNVTDINVKLYDYVETSDIIANPKEDKLYVLFSKDGNFLNYEDYI